MTANDIWIVPLDDHGQPTPVLDTRFNENYARFSPDGRSMMYVSNESGRPEVYVVSREGGGKVQLSKNGGTFPRWRGDGREFCISHRHRIHTKIRSVGSYGTCDDCCAPLETPDLLEE